jgi:hypothetical protein
MALAIVNVWNVIEVTSGKPWMSSKDTIEMARNTTDMIIATAIKKEKE